jgi:hypothetical protein
MRREFRKFFPPLSCDVIDLGEYYKYEDEIVPHVLRRLAQQLDGGVEIKTFRDFYRNLKRRKVALCLINCFVYLRTEREASWWISQSAALQSQLFQEESGPQIILSLAVVYPRGRWFLRRERDIGRFFRKRFVAAPSLEEDRVVLQLSSVTRFHVRQWCEEPAVQRLITRGRIDRARFLQPFARSDEVPMRDILEHLRDVLRESDASARQRNVFAQSERGA